MSHSRPWPRSTPRPLSKAAAAKIGAVPVPLHAYLGLPAWVGKLADEELCWAMWMLELSFDSEWTCGRREVRDLDRELDAVLRNLRAGRLSAAQGCREIKSLDRRYQLLWKRCNVECFACGSKVHEARIRVDHVHRVAQAILKSKGETREDRVLDAMRGYFRSLRKKRGSRAVASGQTARHAAS